MTVYLSCSEYNNSILSSKRTQNGQCNDFIPLNMFFNCFKINCKHCIVSAVHFSISRER